MSKSELKRIRIQKGLCMLCGSSEWISVNDRVPEGKCLTYNVEQEIHAAEYHPSITSIGGHFDFDMPKVTHWMPLPEPPT